MNYIQGLRPSPITSSSEKTMLLSTREREVLFLVAHEHTTNEIAEELFISSHTALSHRKNLMGKLKVKNTAGLVRRAFEVGLLTVSQGQF